MLKIRRPLGRLIFNMGIATPGKTVFLIETAPRWAFRSRQFEIFGCHILSLQTQDTVAFKNLERVAPGHFVLNRFSINLFSYRVYVMVQIDDPYIRPLLTREAWSHGGVGVETPNHVTWHIRSTTRYPSGSFVQYIWSKIRVVRNVCPVYFKWLAFHCPFYQLHVTTFTVFPIPSVSCLLYSAVRVEYNNLLPGHGVI